ncbi:MAG TPA: hypothetical protein VFD43_08870, partial [Planctomycetota bacterium]|nr:hypothetical protein [Planctomycetota bacterium]
MDPAPSSLRPRLAAGLLAAAALLGCDDRSGERELAASRVYEPVGRRISWDASPAQRHGISAGDFAGAAGGASAGDMDPHAGGAAELHWTVPPGWTERPPALFREANFLVAGDERAECYLTTLPGEAGGMDANVNRWRGQLSLPPLDAAEVAALPRVPWLGGEAAFVDFEGRWGGMAGDESEDGWRLVGLLQVGHAGSLFLKMVGPAEVIDGQLEAFHALADSFHVGHEGDHEGEGVRFFENLTEPVVLKGERREPLVVRSGVFWRLNRHVRPRSGWLAAFVSDHWNEALNPNL